MPAQTIINLRSGAGFCTTLIRQAPTAENDSIVLAIKQCISTPENIQFIRDAYRFDGGWEAWLQVVYAVWHLRQRPLDKIEREKHIYSDLKKEVDLWIELSNGQTVAVELKCAHRNMGDSWTNDSLNTLPGGMMADIDKINGEIRTVYQGEFRYCVGITFNPVDLIYNVKAPGGGTGTFGWKNRANVYWDYIHQPNNMTAADDFDRVRYANSWPGIENIYLIWYKA